MLSTVKRNIIMFTIVAFSNKKMVVLDSNFKTSTEKRLTIMTDENTIVFLNTYTEPTEVAKLTFIERLKLAALFGFIEGVAIGIFTAVIDALFDNKK